MSLFKCKMCGGDLYVQGGVTVTECEYCGTKQTLPKAADENLQNLYNRANTLRIKSEFDKAEKIYEKIIQSNSTESEAYWGLILCRYGIEYVDDPKTFKKIPTCHRASYDSIIADEDYKAALANADMHQRILYEEQAREIDRIQKEILALAQNEEGYDVFICYKETDQNGKRTQDSVIANDIYYQLKNEGYKVFYAAITLEGKLGSAYEPIIFAALNSAKVMLAIGTKPEYFNAVWVKNEWSRFLKIIKKDRSKILIPCYRGMDAYALPEEFAHLQAQDMSKIGFVNDIVRGIKKVVKKDVKKDALPKAEDTKKEKPVVQSNSNVAPLLRRAFIFLEDGEFKRADDFCEQVLNQEPECAKAYLGKLMAELKLHTPRDFAKCKLDLSSNSNYKRFLMYSDEKIKDEINQYLHSDKEGSDKEESEKIKLYNEKIENTQNDTFDEEYNAEYDAEYNKALNLMAHQTHEKYEEAERIFRQISGYKDSDLHANICRTKLLSSKLLADDCDGHEFAKEEHLTYELAVSLMNEDNKDSYEKAKKMLLLIPNYKNAHELIARCRKEILYHCAMINMSRGLYDEALKQLRTINGWRESARFIEECKKESAAREKQLITTLCVVGSIVFFVLILMMLLTNT